MNHLEKTYSDMENNCLSLLHNNEKLWTGEKVIKEEVVALDKNKKELENAFEAQKSNDPGGQVAQKRKDLNSLANLFYKSDRKLCHLAKVTNNQALLKTVDIPLSGFLYGEEKGILLKYNTILAALRDNLTSLATYKFTQANLSALEAQLNKLAAIPGAISIMSNSQRSATRTIKELIDEAHTILDRLDDAVEGLIDDDKFIESWHDARKIKGRRNYKKADQGRTADTQTSSK